MNHTKYRHATYLKFGDMFFTSPTTLELEAKAIIDFTIKENLILYCRRFSVFVAAIMNLHTLIISQRNAACITEIFNPFKTEAVII